METLANDTSGHSPMVSTRSFVFFVGRILVLNLPHLIELLLLVLPRAALSLATTESHRSRRDARMLPIHNCRCATELSFCQVREEIRGKVSLQASCELCVDIYTRLLLEWGKSFDLTIIQMVYSRPTFGHRIHLLRKWPSFSLVPKQRRDVFGTFVSNIRAMLISLRI